MSAILLLVYGLCGFCAALGGLIALTQTGAVSPKFGGQREFAAIQLRLGTLTGLHANRRRIKFIGSMIVMQSMIANAIPPNPFQIGRRAS